MMSLFLARLARCVLLALALIIYIPSFATAESGPGARDFVTGLLEDSDFAVIFRAMSQYFPVDARNLEVSLRRTADQLGVDRTNIIPTDDVTRMTSAAFRNCLGPSSPKRCLTNLQNALGGPWFWTT